MEIKYKFDAPQSRKKHSQSLEQSVELINARIGRIEKKKNELIGKPCEDNLLYTMQNMS